MPRVSVVVPVYNNAASLEELHARLVATLKAENETFELIFVEDGSRDGSWSILERIARHDACVKALRLSRNFGQHPALAAGFDVAEGEVIILMDADLQDRPEDIPQLLAALTPEVDIVYSTKCGTRESWSVSLTSRLYHFVFSRIARVAVPRNIGTFRAFSRDVLLALRDHPEKNILYGPLMLSMGFHHVTIDLPYTPRPYGRSSYTFSRRLALAISSLVSYSDLPHRVTLGGGMLAVVGSILYALALVIQYLIVGRCLPPGMTVMIFLLTLFFGMTMLSLGFLGTYLFRVYQEVLDRPRYIIARRLNLPPPSRQPAAGQTPRGGNRDAA